jgi:hypothetical protein
MSKATKTAKAEAVWRSKYDAAAKVKLLVKGNPHRPGTKDRRKWAKLRAGATVRALVAGGVELSYLRYVEQRGLVKIG